MHYYIKPENEKNSSTIWGSDGTHKWAFHSSAQLKQDQDMQFVRLLGCGMNDQTAHGFAYDEFVVEKEQWKAYGFNIDPQMTGRDPWGWKS